MDMVRSVVTEFDGVQKSAMWLESHCFKEIFNKFKGKKLGSALIVYKPKTNSYFISLIQNHNNAEYFLRKEFEEFH